MIKKTQTPYSFEEYYSSQMAPGQQWKRGMLGRWPVKHEAVP